MTPHAPLRKEQPSRIGVTPLTVTILAKLREHGPMTLCNLVQRIPGRKSELIASTLTHLRKAKMVKRLKHVCATCGSSRQALWSAAK